MFSGYFRLRAGSAWLLGGGVDLTIYEVYELKQVLSRATAAKSLCTENFMNKAKLLLELQALKFYTYSCIKLSPCIPSHLENLCTVYIGFLTSSTTWSIPFVDSMVTKVTFSILLLIVLKM